VEESKRFRSKDEIALQNFKYYSTTGDVRLRTDGSFCKGLRILSDDQKLQQPLPAEHFSPFRFVSFLILSSFFSFVSSLCRAVFTAQVAHALLEV
jgi:hypothetical protein